MNDFLQLPNLASERLGARVVNANDDFFAPKENLLKDAKPVFIEGKYTSRGKWMDGWETRRRRIPGYDWCVLRLGLPGIIRGLVVDTSFFTGNFPERFSLEGCNLAGKLTPKNEKLQLSSEKINWLPIFPETLLKGDSENLFIVDNGNRFTHLRLKIYPDGGVARLRIHGEALPDTKRISGAEINLVAVENGGSVVTSSDQHYGAAGNLLMPYPAKNMGDGWETKRRRGSGYDWVILKLGVSGRIHRIEVDTTHFKGNFPDSCSLETCHAKQTALNPTNISSQNWLELLPNTKLRPNHCHIFKSLAHSSTATHVRFNIYPDGGVSRLRILGRPEIASNSLDAIKRFNALPAAKARELLLDCCGSTTWAVRVASQRPFVAPSELFTAADNIWSALAPEDWLQAFRHHPPIGGNRAKAKQSATATRWSAKEQATAHSASPDIQKELTVANKTYTDKFGFVFLICATGKSSREILSDLQRRLPNDPQTELSVAAEEQRKITHLRLEKLLNS